MTELLDGRLFGPDQPCFGCGPVHPHGLRLRFDRDGDEVVTRYMPHEGQQGAPGIMHGGLVTTLADEVAAWAVIATLGKFGFTATMTAKFRRPVRVGLELEARARIVKARPRVIDVTVKIAQEDELAFEGEFRFAVLDRTGAERLLGGPLPDQWLRFAR